MNDTPQPENDRNTELQPGGNPDWEQIQKIRDEQNRIEGLVPLSELTPRIDAVAKRWELVRGDEVIIWESTETPYRYMLAAWEILAGGKPGVWKTVGILRTLRQAIREVTAQGMELDFPKKGAGLKKIRHFLTIARHFDTIHHGMETF